MSKLKTITAALLLLVMAAPYRVCADELPGAVCVTDYVAADTGADVADALQAVIDENPNRTIYFPDGVYLVSHPLRTPADPAKSVDLQLANYAVIQATRNFTGGAVIALGGKDPYNTTAEIGSNYSLTGGVIDGNNIATGVSIDSGRETKVQNTAIKHAVVGLHIKYGANSGSSDADIRDVNIIGSRASNSVGMLIEGFDNTFTNIRIGGARTGVIMRSAGNSLTNVHPLFNVGLDKYDGSCGFVEESDNNLYTYCYSDQFQTAFKIAGNGRSVYDNCFAYWWSGEGGVCTGFRVEGDSFNSTVTNLRIDFRNDTYNTLYNGPTQGTGVFQRLMVNEKLLSANRTYRIFTETCGSAHSLTFVEAKDATAETKGNVAYYHCASCGKNFSDADGTQELTDVTAGAGSKQTPSRQEDGVCAYCGERHDGAFGWLVSLFHGALGLFGLRK